MRMPKKWGEYLIIQKRRYLVIRAKVLLVVIESSDTAFSTIFISTFSLASSNFLIHGIKSVAAELSHVSNFLSISPFEILPALMISANTCLSSSAVSFISFRQSLRIVGTSGLEATFLRRLETMDEALLADLRLTLSAVKQSLMGSDLMVEE